MHIKKLSSPLIEPIWFSEQLEFRASALLELEKGCSSPSFKWYRQRWEISTATRIAAKLLLKILEWYSGRTSSLRLLLRRVFPPPSHVYNLTTVKTEFIIKKIIWESLCLRFTVNARVSCKQIKRGNGDAGVVDHEQESSLPVSFYLFFRSIRVFF